MFHKTLCCKDLRVFAIALNSSRFLSTHMNFNSELFQKVKTKELCQVCDAIKNSGYEVRLVGGVVRDLIQGLPSKDVDLCTNAVPCKVAEILRLYGIRCIETGLQHGTVTAHINKRDFEITTLRTDEVTDGRHAEVKFINDWKEDAERRDLTINAMSMELDGTLYDYFDGYNDLLQKRVRFVGDARKRIKEDYLRILRYFRFLARIVSFESIEKSDSGMTNIHNIIIEERSGLRNVSVERIWLELKQIFIGPNAPAILRLLHRCDIFKFMRLEQVNEENIVEFERAYNNSKRLKNVNIHPCTLLASLFNSNGDIDKGVSELKFSRHDSSLTTFIFTNRQSTLKNVNQNSSKYTSRKCVEMDHYDNVCTEKYENLLVLNYKPKEVESLREFVLQLILYEGNENILDRIDKWTIPIFPVNGNDLRSLSIQGKNCGAVLGYLKEIWIKSRFTLTKTELFEQIISFS